MNQSKKIVVLLNFFFFLGFLFYNCEGDTIDTALEMSCDSTNITYLTNVKAILETNCGSTQNNCHFNGAAKASYSFEDYNASKTSIQNAPTTLICSIRHSAGCMTMPNRNDPSIKLSEEDIVTIEQWICLGYAE